VAFGAQAHDHFLPESALDPWLGAGLGYEVLGLTQSGGDRINPNLPSEEGNSYSGFFLSLQAGADFKASSSFAMGPFVSAAIGHYNVSSLSLPNYDRSDTMDGGIHEWFTLGVRGQFDL
jgi:hypothetical protein